LPELAIGGITPLTSTDYPGCLAAVVFCQGCPLRCPYCQNPHLIPPRAAHNVSWREVVAFLKRRRGLLDAVVFSGGEPTLQGEALADALRQTRALGFRTGLHTAAPYPETLAALLPLLDWVGMDIKALFTAYEAITGVPGSGEKVYTALRLLLQSGVAHEIRTTVHPQLHSVSGLLQLAEELQGLGVKSFALQEFRAQGCDDGLLRASASAPLLTDELCTQIGARFEHFTLRRAG
jgi:anaerobic ribonucleoside-triphosphate reductase activating protein